MADDVPPPRLGRTEPEQLLKAASGPTPRRHD
jgi:hypothetical protein